MTATRCLSGLAVLLTVIVASSPGCSRTFEDGHDSADAELILTNARVYTLSWDEPAADGAAAPGAPRDEHAWYPDADAVAIGGGEILFVGGTEDALAFRGEKTRVVDLDGATVIPGLVDSHTHVFGIDARQVDLTQ